MSNVPIPLTPDQLAYLQSLGVAEHSHEQPQNGPPPGLEASGQVTESAALIAFAQALSAVENVAKTQEADTGKYKYRYADLGDVLDEVKRACSMFKLAVTQNPSQSNGMLSVGTTVIHYETGQWLTFPPIMLKAPNDAQALGSALTYLRRYALLTIFGIAPEDDDGAEATRIARRQESSGYRSEAERMIHERMSAMDPDEGKAMRSEFRATFGMGLSDLPIAKHGDALTWVRQWRPSEADPATAEGAGEEGDAADTPAASPTSDKAGSEIPAEVTPDAAERAGIEPELAP